MCFFLGVKGNYSEKIFPIVKMYGLTKSEVDSPNHLTLRTSIIGHEIKNFVSNGFLMKNEIKGYPNVLFSLTTLEIANLLKTLSSG